MFSSLSSTIRTVLAIRFSFACEAMAPLGLRDKPAGWSVLSLPIARSPGSRYDSGREDQPPRSGSGRRAPHRPDRQANEDFLRNRKRMAMGKRDCVEREAAESLAIQVLTYLAAEPERLGRFLSLSGVGPPPICAAATEPGFLAGVLDYVSADESLLLEFADHAGVDPEDVVRAQAALSGERWEREIP